MKGIRLLLFSLIIAVLVPSGLSGLELEYQGLDWEAGFLWKHNEGYDTEEGDSGPDLFTVFPAISAYFTIDEHWFFKPSIFFYTETLQYLPDRDYTIPVDQSNIDSMTVLGIMIEPAAGYRWVVGGQHTFGVQGGLGINLQIPLWGPGSDDRGDMFVSLIKEFLYVNPGIWYYNPLTEKFAFTIRSEVCLPVYNLFSGRGLPFSDGLTIIAMVGIRVLVQ